MHAEDIITIAFDDVPKMEQLEAVISGWYRPEPPNRLENAASAFCASGEMRPVSHLLSAGTSQWEDYLLLII